MLLVNDHQVVRVLRRKERSPVRRAAESRFVEPERGAAAGHRNENLRLGRRQNENCQEV